MKKLALVLAAALSMGLSPVRATAATFSEYSDGVYVNSDPSSAETPLGHLVADVTTLYFGCMDSRYCGLGWFLIQPSHGQLVYSQGGDNAYAFSGIVTAVNYGLQSIDLTVRLASPFVALVTNDDGTTSILYKFDRLSVTLGNLMNGGSDPSAILAGMGDAGSDAGSAYVSIVGSLPVPAAGVLLLTALAGGAGLRRDHSRRRPDRST